MLNASQIHKPWSDSDRAVRLAALIDIYPGINGEICVGGAETNLQRLIQFIQRNHGGEIQSTVFVRRGTLVAQDPLLNSSSSNPSFVRPWSLSRLTSFLIREQRQIDLLYLVDKTLYFRVILLLRVLKGFKKPILFRVTSSKFLDYLKWIPAWLRTLLYQKFLGGRRDIFVLSLSQDCYDRLRTLGIDKDRIISIPNAVDLSRYQPPQDKSSIRLMRERLFPEMNSDGCVFVYVGRIIGWHKRVDHLLEAWNLSGLSARGHRLLLVGAPKKDVFITDGFKIWERCGPVDGRRGVGKLEGTYWTGLVPVEDIPSYLWMSDVFVLPSDFEGMSNAAIEALASGLPVIGRRGVSGNAELIDSQVTGMFFENIPELVQRLQWMTLSENRKGMREAALHKAQGFSVDSMCNRYVSFFKSIRSAQ